MAVCPNCSSSGTMLCGTCRGSGIINGTEKCPGGCNNGVKPCITCGGTGRV